MEARQQSRARWLASLFFILSGLLTASWSSRIPDIQRHLELSNAAWGTVLFAGPVGQFSSLFVAGWLTSRFGVQKTMVGSTIVLALALLLAGASLSSIQLMAALLGIGFGRTVLNISVNTNAAQIQKGFSRPIMSTYHGLWSLACFAAVGFGTLMIIGKVAPLPHFAIVGGFCLACTLVYEIRRKKTERTTQERRPFLVKPDKYLVLLGCITFCGMLCENVMFDWSVNYFSKVVQVKQGLVTAGYTGFILAMTVGRLLGDRLVGRFGATSMLMFNGLLMAAGFLLAAFFPMLFTALLGFILVGLGSSIVAPVVFTLAAQSTKMPPAYALTAVTMIGYAGFLVAPLLIGSLSDAFSMQGAFAVVSCFGLGILLLSSQVQKLQAAQEIIHP